MLLLIDINIDIGNQWATQVPRSLDQTSESSSEQHFYRPEVN